jgi:hypothetical protein
MTRHLSGRQPRLNVGISSFTETLTVLQVTGRVAIGTTNAGTYSLYVVGDTNIDGQIGINTLKVQSGIITNLAGTNLNYAGVGTINNFISTTASISTLDGNIVRFNTGIVTSISGSNLYYRSGIVTNILGTNLNYTGIGTVNNFISTTANITTLSGDVLRFNSGIVTNIQGTNLFYSGIGTIGSFIATNSTILTLSGSAVRYSSGIVTNISGSNLNYSGISTFNVTDGPLYVGSATSTGTRGQTFQVVGVNSGAFFGGNVGIGSTLPTSKLSVQGNVLVSGIITALGIGGTFPGFVGVLQGAANYAYAAGFSTFSSTSGFATVSTWAGISTVSSVSGFSTYSSTSGFSTVSSIAGFATVAAVAGFSSVATASGFSTISAVAGFATVSTQSGFTTTVIGGIASVTQLSVTGISSLNVGIFSGNTFTDLVRITQLGTGNALTVEDSTNPDLSAFIVDATGRVGIGTTIASNPLLAFTNNTGLPVAEFRGDGTLAGAAIYARRDNNTDAGIKLYGTSEGNFVYSESGVTTGRPLIVDSAQNQNIIVRIGSSNKATIQPSGEILVGTSASTGTANQLIQVGSASTPAGAYVSGNTGIGTTNPGSKLSVIGDAFVSGILTAGTFSGQINSGIATITTANIPLANITNANIVSGLVTTIVGTSLSYSGVGTIRTFYTDNAFITNLSVVNDLFVGGNVAIAGSSFFINVNELRVEDKDIIIGFTTTNNPSDITANHSGIAIASTEGVGLVPLQAIGLSTLPESYKQLMWLKSGTWSGLTTDAFMFNYGVGIGSTQIPNGVRLAVGYGIQMTDTNISSPAGTFSGNLASFNTINATNQQNTGVTTSIGGFRGQLTGAANYAYLAGVSTYAYTSGFSTVASIAGFTTQAAVAGFASISNITGVATFSSLAGSAGFATVATQAGVATNVISGVASISALNVTGLSTFTQISAGGTTGTNQYVLTSTGSGLAWQAVTGIGAITGVNIAPDSTNAVSYIPFVKVASGTTATEYTDSTLTYNSGTQRLGIGTTNPGSTLDVMGTLYVRDYITSPTFYGNFVGITSGVTFYAYNAGVSTIASVAGFATVSTVAGIASYSTLAGSAGFATVSTVAGVATFSTLAGSAGFSTFSSTSGFSTVSSIAGFATVSIQAGVSTIAAVAGFATVATQAGVSTLATYAYSAGFTTFSGVAGFSTVASIAGFATYAGNVGFATFSGIAGYSTVAGTAGFSTVATQAGIATNVVGGVANVVSLNVSGISTHVGFATFQQNVYVAGVVTATDGRLIAGVGIESRGVAIGAGVTTLNFIGLGNTFLIRGTTVDISIQGGGGNSLSISTSNATDLQYLTFVSSATTSVLGIGSTANPIVFTPSSGNLGLGTTTASSKLTVRGDVLISGVVTSTTGGFVGQLTGVTNYAYSAGFSTYAGNVGFSTFAGIAGYSTVAGTAGFSSYTSIAGFATVSSVSGFATVATQAGVSTISAVAGFATVSTQAGISTNVVGGVASVNTLQVLGISTFTNGPLYIGAGQTIGVTSAIVQITGINSSLYVGGKVGIGTTDFTYGLNVNGDINTASVIRVNGRNILDDAVIYAIALG